MHPVDRTEVVVGHDGSDGCAPALAWAAAEAARRVAPLRLVTAAGYPTLAPGTGGSPSWTSPGATDAVARVAARGVARVRGRWPGVPVRVTTTTGGAAAALDEAASTAALLVVGPRGAGRTAAALGSVAAAVVAAAACPVVVVRGPERPAGGRPVVAGVDGSPVSEDVLRLAADHAAGVGAPLEVLTAWRAAAADPDGSPRDAPRGHAERLVADAVAGVGATHPGLVVAGRVVEDPPACALAAASRDAALLVVGSRGPGTAPDLPLGPVARAVVRTTACPVAVVHSPVVHFPVVHSPAGAAEPVLELSAPGVR